MHPLFNQQLAKYHMRDLQCEAETARFAAQVDEPESSSSHRYLLIFLRFLHDRTRVLYRRSVVLKVEHPEAVNLEEIKPALVATFSVMHDVGLVSEYDEQFIEKFVQTFEYELAHQFACKSS
jgi:hypothetical protein